MNKMEYLELPEFSKEFKRLKKKFITLDDDFEMAKKAAIELFHLRGINNQSTFEIPGLNGIWPVFKLKKFACQSLKGKGVQSGIPMIYAWNKVESKIIWIEVYYKGEKEIEDKSRIKAYLKSISSKDHR
jgi:hypothetical protein